MIPESFTGTTIPSTAHSGRKNSKNRKAFSYVRRLYDRLNESGLNLDVLSMGMSGDYIQAIDEGSNEVRIGTAIFGQRNYNA